MSDIGIYVVNHTVNVMILLSDATHELVFFERRIEITSFDTNVETFQDDSSAMSRSDEANTSNSVIIVTSLSINMIFYHDQGVHTTLVCLIPKLSW